MQVGRAGLGSLLMKPSSWRGGGSVPGPLARENEGRRRPARLALCRCEHHHRHDDPFTAPAADAVACSWDPRRRIHGHPWVVHGTEAHRAKNLVRCRHRTCLPPSTVLRPSSWAPPAGLTPRVRGFVPVWCPCRGVLVWGGVSFLPGGPGGPPDGACGQALVLVPEFGRDSSFGVALEHGPVEDDVVVEIGFQ